MRTVKMVVRAVRVAFTSALALILVCNLYFIGVKSLTGEHPTLFGWSMAVVISGSMSPAIEVDDMVIIHRQSEYECGDVVMYKDGDSLVTHRVAEVTDTGYITKGDANNTPDPPIAADRVVGKTVLVIPKIGRLTSAARTPLGMCILVMIGIGLIEAPAIAEKVKKRAAKENKNEPCDE